MEDEYYVNVDRATRPVNPRPSTNQTGPNGSKIFHGAVVLCLGLLSVCLLAGLVGLAIHSAEVSALKAELTERLQTSDDAFSSLTKERDRLNALLTCPAGWMKFTPSCYLLSEKSDSWENARNNCRSMGADLVVIDSTEEQEFLYSFNDTIRAWIGLTDIIEEGTWKWINGAPLSLQYWWAPQAVAEPGGGRGWPQPDNGGGPGGIGEEDCAHIMNDIQNSNNWNDMSCNNDLRWICEKMVCSTGEVCG